METANAMKNAETHVRLNDAAPKLLSSLQALLRAIDLLKAEEIAHGGVHDPKCPVCVAARGARVAIASVTVAL